MRTTMYELDSTPAPFVDPVDLGVSGAVINALVAEVRAVAGESGVAQLLVLAGEKRTFDSLAAETEWTARGDAIALCNAASLVIQDTDVGLRVGRALLHPPAGPEEGPAFLARLSALASTAEALKHVGPLLSRFDGGLDAGALHIEDDHALIEVTPLVGHARDAHLCELTRGVLIELPTLFGSEPAQVSEPECAARGGLRCLYAVSWDQGGTARSEGSLDDEDPGAAKITTPDAPVPTTDRTPKERTRPAPPPPSEAATPSESSHGSWVGRLTGARWEHASSCVESPLEVFASALAEYLDGVIAPGVFHLQVTGGARDGSWSRVGSRGDDPTGGFVVRLATEAHHYGTLAVAGADVTAAHVVAAQATTLLDLRRRLALSRQRDDTTQSLLAFSQALAHVSEPFEAVSLLAATVPEITGADDATVYLWDESHRALVPRVRARDDGTCDDLLAALGAIAPMHLQHSPPEDESATPVDAHSPLLRRLVEEHAPIVIDASCGHDDLVAWLERSGYQQAVCAPIFASGLLLGVVATFFLTPPQPSIEEDSELLSRLTSLVDQAGASVRNLELVERVRHLAWHDPLTGLANRRLFEDRVDQELSRSQRAGDPVCLFFIDLDNFKGVNDVHGHATGDALIKEVADRLRSSIRQQDTAARVGGDEFVLLLPSISDPKHIVELAQRTLAILRAPFVFDDLEITVSASIGIAVAPEHGTSYDDLVNHADHAMYRAKAQGRDSFTLFRPVAVEGTPFLEDERALVTDLVRALRHGELFVLFQPCVDLVSGQIESVEALVRWHHPTEGVIEPSAFIAAVERSAVVVDLDRWVLDEACRQARTWVDVGITTIPVSVNVAGRSFEDDEFATTVEEALHRHGLAPHLLRLEVTERVPADLGPVGHSNIERLRNLGVGFLLDNFGTGNSTLSRIGTFPIATIKVARSYLPNDVQGSVPGATTALRSIHDTSTQLGLVSIAEGIETAEQSAAVLAQGMHLGQGNFVSPPLRADALRRFVTQSVRTPGAVPVPDGELPE